MGYIEHVRTMVMNHSSCHDPPSLHPLLPGGVGYHCSAEPKGGNDVSATFACMDTWQPFVGWLPWGELTLRRMAHWGRWFAHGKLMFFRIYVGLQEDICWYVLPKISQTCYWYWFAKMWTGASTISWFLVPMSQFSMLQAKILSWNPPTQRGSVHRVWRVLTS